MKDDDVPPAIRKHPELAKLLQLTQLTECNPEAHAAVMEFLRACEPLSKAELAKILAYGDRLLGGKLKNARI